MDGLNFIGRIGQKKTCKTYMYIAAAMTATSECDSICYTLDSSESQRIFYDMTGMNLV